MTRDLAWFVMPLLVQAGAARAMPAAGEIDPAQLCRAAIAATERVTRIPDEFLEAISRVETGRDSGGTVSPWPWTVNAGGTGHFYATREAAVEAVRRFMASGIHSLDVGCMQVSLLYHPEAFGNLDQAFDPAANAAFAGKLLMALFQQTGSWPRAAAAYHSLTPALGEAYQKKVLEAWAMPDRPRMQTPRSKASARRNMADALPAAPPALIAPAYAAPPTMGFTRRFMMPQRSGAPLGRSLADYRATSVRMVLHAPEGMGGVRGPRPVSSQD